MCRPMLSRSLLAIVLGVCCLGSAAGQVNQKAIEEVRAGKVKVARASWWGFDPEDSTQALQAAINSGVPKLIVEDMGRPWIVTPIQLAGNQEITFEQGTEVLAKQGEFRGTGDCLFTASCQQNVALIGYGAVLRMRRSDYSQAPYRKAEWRHVLQFLSCRKVRVYGLTLAESGGDGIYLGTGKAGVSNREVHIKDVLCARNYRQGISVITADGLLIENTVMRDTAGTPPMAGIDFEPNEASERLTNVVMRNCTTRGNRGCGYAIYIPTLDGSSAPVSLRFEHCRAWGDSSADLALATGNTPAAAVKGSIEFVGCAFRRSRAAGIVISDKPYNGCRLRFEDCSILNVAAKAPAQSPILLTASQQADEPIGGIEFRDCLVRDDLDRNPMAYQDSAGGLELKDIGGNLVLEHQGQRTPLALTDQVLGRWMPVVAMKALPRLALSDFSFVPPPTKPAPASLRLGFASVRGRVRAVLYADRGDPVALTVRHQRVGAYGGSPALLTVTDPSGQEAARAELPFMAETELRFTAPQTGLYRISAEVSPNSLAFVSTSHPVGLTGDGQSVDLISTQGEFFLWVPAGSREFAVRVVGEGGEGIKAGLYDSSGKLVEEQDDISALHQFLVELPQPSTGEAWSLRLAKATNLFLEDCHVDLRALPPLLAPSREAVLVAVRR